MRLKLLIVLTAVVFVLVVIGYQMTQETSPDGVSVSQAKNLIAQGAVVIDLSSPGDYAAGHIEGALSVPYDGCWPCIEEVVTTYPREQLFLLYQHSGHEQSESVTADMKAVGFTNVSYLIGGYQTWSDEQK